MVVIKLWVYRNPVREGTGHGDKGVDVLPPRPGLVDVESETSGGEGRGYEAKYVVRRPLCPPQDPTGAGVLQFDPFSLPQRVHCDKRLH